MGKYVHSLTGKHFKYELMKTHIEAILMLLGEIQGINKSQLGN